MRICCKLLRQFATVTDRFLEINPVSQLTHGEGAFFVKYGVRSLSHSRAD